MKSKELFPRLFKPAHIGKVKIRNRLVMLPIGGYFCGVNSDVTDRSIAYFVERSKGGVGLITVGLTCVTGVNEPITKRYFTLGEDHLLKGHYHLTEAVHIHGAKISIQLCHVGGQMSAADFGGKPPLSPSGITQYSVNRQPFSPPRAMTRSEIYQMIEYFVNAAARAQKAGYDMVEVHAAHGYLLSAFVSPATNKRTDEFGGSPQNRVRIVTEIIKGIHQVTGADFLVVVRVNADDYIPDGITLDEAKIVVKELEKAGADVLSVSCGTYLSHYKMDDTMDLDEGWKIPLWDGIKKVVSIPIIAGGGNRTPAFCESLIANGHADFVGMGRPLLADPYLPCKVREGREGDINRCLSCLRCMLAIGGGFQDVRHCTVNAMWGREVEYIKNPPATTRKKVLVAGGGVAGMEAARVSSLRGHDVTIYEKGKELGGQLGIASVPVTLGKHKLLWLRDYLEKQLTKQGVKVMLGAKVTPAVVRRLKPDVLIMATGAESLVPEIPDSNRKNVISSWDVLRDKPDFGRKNIAVLGGNAVGCETAHFLAEKGNKVTIIKRRPTICEDIEPINRQVLLNKLEDCKVKVMTGKRVIAIKKDGVGVEDMVTGKKETVKADWVVLALGARTVRDLEAMEDKVPEFFAIGDCRKPRTILDAVAEGFLVGQNI